MNIVSLLNRPLKVVMHIWTVVKECFQVAMVGLLIEKIIFQINKNFLVFRLSYPFSSVSPPHIAVKFFFFILVFFKVYFF